jgi:hypothetical protein
VQLASDFHEAGIVLAFVTILSFRGPVARCPSDNRGLGQQVKTPLFHPCSRVTERRAYGRLHQAVSVHGSVKRWGSAHVSD